MRVKKRKNFSLRNFFRKTHYYLSNLVLFSIFLFFIVNLANLQIFKFTSSASTSESRASIIKAPRGEIYAVDKDGNLYSIASNEVFYKVYFKNFRNYPKEKLQEFYHQIAKIITPRVSLEEFLDSGQKLLFLGEVDLNKRKELSKLNLDVIWFEQDYRRIYPYKDLIKIVGFVQEKGVYGLESYYDNFLKKVDGLIVDGKIKRVPEKGYDLVTSLDINVQTNVFNFTKEFMKEYDFKEAIVIVMSAKDGSIVAWVEIPSYDPNEYNKVSDFSLFKIKGVEPFEPGSVIKPFLYSLAIENKLITPQAKYEDKGYVFVDGQTISNWDKRKYGVITFQEALNKSLNTGAIYIQNLLGEAKTLEFFEKLGFEESTGVDLFEEVGSLKTLRKPFGRKINFFTASFGQGISVTPIRLISDFLMFAKDGTILRPFIVKEIRSDHIEKFSGAITSKLISQETAKVMNKMLQEVVEDGYGKKARMEKFWVAGKTGTAQVFNKELQRYDDRKIIHTFLGYFPATRPEFAILVILKEPKDNSIISSQTAPKLWKRIAEYLVDYYGILPDKY